MLVLRILSSPKLPCVWELFYLVARKGSERHRWKTLWSFLEMVVSFLCFASLQTLLGLVTGLWPNGKIQLLTVPLPCEAHTSLHQIHQPLFPNLSQSLCPTLPLSLTHPSNNTFYHNLYPLLPFSLSLSLSLSLASLLPLHLSLPLPLYLICLYRESHKHTFSLSLFLSFSHTHKQTHTHTHSPYAPLWLPSWYTWLRFDYARESLVCRVQFTEKCVHSGRWLAGRLPAAHPH